MNDDTYQLDRPGAKGNFILAKADFPWPLRIRCLGRFGVLVDGLPLTFHTKAQKKPLELLKALIGAGGRSVSVASLSTQVWPELEGDAAQNAFNIALMRLRRLLRNDHALVLQEGKLTLDSRHAWVDSWAFERLVNRVDALGTRPAAAAAETAERLAARALELYQGHFLAHEEQPWALACRERLRSKFLRYFSGLGKHLESDRKLDAAIELYRRAIEIEPLAEAFHQRLMRVLKTQGRIAEALDAYRRCRDLLSITLSVDPSGETQALYRSLTDGQARFTEPMLRSFVNSCQRSCL